MRHLLILPLYLKMIMANFVVYKLALHRTVFLKKGQLIISNYPPKFSIPQATSKQWFTHMWHLGCHCVYVSNPNFFFFKHYPLRNQLGSTCHRILAIAQLRAKIIKKAPHFQNEPISDLETSYYFQPCVWQQLMPGIHLDINETILFNNTIQLPKFLDILWPATTHIVFYSTIANTTYLSL